MSAFRLMAGNYPARVNNKMDEIILESMCHHWMKQPDNPMVSLQFLDELPSSDSMRIVKQDLHCSKCSENYEFYIHNILFIS
jgi:hypothetical protein